MSKSTTRPTRDSRRWRQAAMNNPLCKEGNGKLVLFFLTIAGALLMGLIGSILAYTLPSEPVATPYGLDAPARSESQSYSLR